VQEQNLGAVEDFILPYSAVYLRVQKWKKYWNRSTFAKVIVKIKVAPFLMAHGVYSVCSVYHPINKCLLCNSDFACSIDRPESCRQYIQCTIKHVENEKEDK